MKKHKRAKEPDSRIQRLGSAGLKSAKFLYKHAKPHLQNMATHADDLMYRAYKKGYSGHYHPNSLKNIALKTLYLATFLPIIYAQLINPYRINTENITGWMKKPGIHSMETGNKNTIENSLQNGKATQNSQGSNKQKASNYQDPTRINEHYRTGYSMIVREVQNIYHDREKYPYMDGNRKEYLVKLCAAIMKAESRGDPNAVSPRGVRGRMQVTISTGKLMGEDRDTDRGNVRAGIKYLKKQLDTYGWKNPSRAFLAYKCGDDSVSNLLKYGWQYLGSENRDYLQRAEAQLKRLRDTKAFN
ncbi:MAG: lytic transglycosylase domain-containing protein [Candidatus Woesearchaeota archaeon]